MVVQQFKYCTELGCQNVSSSNDLGLFKLTILINGYPTQWDLFLEDE